MTESHNFDMYERRVQEIQLANQPLLEGFEIWLKQSHLSEKTIKDHVANIHFFARFLVLYTYSLQKLDEATSSEVSWFLADWFPRKALWASPTSMKLYFASFKKFFKWMGETGLVPPERVADVLDTLKLDRDEFLANVVTW